MTSKIAEELDRGAKDTLWLHEHRRELMDRYRDRWVAVRDLRVIADDPDFDALLARLAPEERGYVVIDLITDDEITMILWLRSAIS